MEAQSFLGFLSKLASESGKAVADAVFSSYNHGSVTQYVVCALIHVQPHRTLVERVESACTLFENCCRTKLVVDGALSPNVSSFIVEFVWRVLRTINWTRDYILQQIVGELEYSQFSSGSAGAANVNTCICTILWVGWMLSYN